MTFKDASSSYNGKMLKAVLDLGNDEIMEVQIYYSDERIHEKNDWGVSVPRYTGYQDIVTHVSRMKHEGAFYTGGIGRFHRTSSTIKRKAIKDLWKFSETLTVEKIMAIEQQGTKPAGIL